MATPDYDIVIVGAGISGINAAYRIQTAFPSFKYCILEARNAIGGTWDLFKYPGIRSDSDLFTFGFQWYPWNQNNPIGTGESILKYLGEATSKFGIDKNIRFHHRVQHGSWSTEDQQWNLTVDSNGQTRPITARYVIFGTGYYDYSTPLQAKIPGLDNFQGQTIHPQFWPEDLDYSGKKVVVVGSGATAVTLLPKLAEKAKLATMLQRSPTYIVELPNRNANSWIDYILPRAACLQLKRIRWILTSRLLFLFCQAFPSTAKWALRRRTARALPKHMSVDPHFIPSYNPWEQRLCVCPDGDFYKALHTGHADVVTGTIKSVTATGIELNSGQFLDADIIVTATGLKLQLAGGATVDVDGQPVKLSEKFIWRSSMLQDVPNASFIIGYTNASWTLGADATASLVVRLLEAFRDKECTSVVPRVPNPEQLVETSVMDLKSTYVKTAQSVLPKAATEAPWMPRDNYISDTWHAMFGSLDGLEWVNDTFGNGKVYENGKAYGNGTAHTNGKA
ncbi:hypothetical protein QQS21_004573 [Conoideocrella luteorostrata]|uniref:Flavin-binding monooxygenase n=1 Tax=Conoideocrella luteorostrata TaxID=1105319 RepID=A0AAJ0CR95_9HYPO|nr:hypothetical protein QQS21_004573 [Conoideocrella luteorostrata]